MGVVGAAEAGGPVCGEKRFVVPQPPSIEDFTIVKPISRGAFGKVYLARRNNNSSRLFAVKVVKKADMINKNMVHQVQAERDALALSKSPFIVHLYYSLQSANNIYLVMEYLIGGDVKSLLHIYGYFDEDMAVKYISEVALALDYLHRHGIIHRDLKPDNMLISNEGHIKLTDFGLSKVTLKRELNMIDILTTPSMAKPNRDYFRTPGQVLSLISSLGFNSPAGGKMAAASSMTPVLSESCRSNSTPLIIQNKENSVKANKLLISLPAVNTSSPGMPVKCLTPNLLKFRARRGTSSTSSQSRLCLSSMESDYCSSPKWENGNQDLEGPSYLSSSRLKSSLSDKSAGKLQVGKVTKNLKALESAISPIVRRNGKKANSQNNSKDLGDTPIAGLNPKGFIRKCLYVPNTREEKENMGARGQLRQLPRSPESPPWLASSSLDPIKYHEEESADRVGVKRSFSHVETSPEEDLKENKSTSRYKRPYKVSDVKVNPSTGLTMEINALFLGDPAKSSTKDDQLENGFTPPPTPLENFCSGNAVAKNLLCELDENSEPVESGGPGEDDDTRKESASDGSESSPNNMSITEHPLERKLSDVDRSLKELSFKSESEADTESSEEANAAPTAEGQERPEGTCARRGFTELADDSLASPAMTRIVNASKRRTMVAFRSYNSSINASNLSEPSRISIGSVDKIHYSLACTGSYPLTVTPAQKDRTYKNFQGQSETPYRTPKSVRRGAAQPENEKILGTPDYLAPELLLGKSHGLLVAGPAVDWWALGVCLFEFLTGIPPFNDETPAQVFQNILKRDIPWPEDDETLSVNSHSAIDILLTLDNTKRAGLKELKAHPFFHGMEWDNLQNLPMPFIPQPDDETDTTYFEARNNAQDLKVSGFTL